MKMSSSEEETVVRKRRTLLRDKSVPRKDKTTKKTKETKETVAFDTSSSDPSHNFAQIALLALDNEKAWSAIRDQHAYLAFLTQVFLNTLWPADTKNIHNDECIFYRHCKNIVDTKGIDKLDDILNKLESRHDDKEETVTFYEKICELTGYKGINYKRYRVQKEQYWMNIDVNVKVCLIAQSLRRRPVSQLSGAIMNQVENWLWAATRFSLTHLFFVYNPEAFKTLHITQVDPFLYIASASSDFSVAQRAFKVIATNVHSHVQSYSVFDEQSKFSKQILKYVSKHTSQNYKMSQHHILAFSLIFLLQFFTRTNKLNPVNVLQYFNLAPTFFKTTLPNIYTEQFTNSGTSWNINSRHGQFVKAVAQAFWEMLKAMITVDIDYVRLSNAKQKLVDGFAKEIQRKELQLHKDEDDSQHIDENNNKINIIMNKYVEDIQVDMPVTTQEFWLLKSLEHILYQCKGNGAMKQRIKQYILEQYFTAGIFGGPKIQLTDKVNKLLNQ